MSALREAANKMLKMLEEASLADPALAAEIIYKIGAALPSFRAALAQEQTEPDISRCPQCNGPADNGFDRSIPPNPYLCTKCMAEPLNLSDRAIQKRLAAQWGYVPLEVEK